MLQELGEGSLRHENLWRQQVFPDKEMLPAQAAVLGLLPNHWLLQIDHWPQCKSAVVLADIEFQRIILPQPFHYAVQVRKAAFCCFNAQCIRALSCVIKPFDHRGIGDCKNKLLPSSKEA